MRNTTTSRRLPALFALSVLIALAAMLSLSGDAAAQTVDYDSDNDGYIDITTHQQLNAVRHDVDANGDPTSGGATAYGNAFPNRVTSASGRMGCPSGNCTGYELMNNISLSSYSNWTPIGNDVISNNRYSGDFKGNGYAISNLTINRTGSTDTGLFGSAHTSARIESLGVTNASVTSNQDYTGILVGSTYGEVVACYSTGSVTGTKILGGLVGWTRGSISSSYSTASVSGNEDLGGLLGRKHADASVTNSYSTGAVSGTKNTGGLIGDSGSGTGAVTASYWDTQTSNQSSSSGGSGVTGQTTSGLQTPTGYTGIYAAWNANLDGQSGNDDPWDFGTSSQYPALKYGAANATDALVAQGRAAPDHDADNDNYIDVPTHARLNAIRWDLNGNGARDSVSAADWAKYTAAFPTATATGMGCPGTCVGYELTANINLDTNGNGSHDSADAYYNSGAGWQPIASADSAGNRYTGDFKGNGYAVQNLTINRPSNPTATGLFGFTSSTSRIESLGVTGANVTGNQYVGALVGGSKGEIVACWSTGSVTATSGPSGGLVGWTPNAIHTSYSHASATGTIHVGGLLGACQDCTVTNSYSTGRVTRSSGNSLLVGGLMGSGGAHDAPGSYWDTQTSNWSSSAGSQSAVGKTTAELQNPTDYTGIYAAWNVNLDGVAGNDDPWDFKGASAYPALVYHHTDYDTDEDNLIEISNLAQLNAIRWNLNGRGDSTNAVYVAAFPNRSASATKRMGCPAGNCAGYELVADLDFDSDGDDDVDANDHGGAYWNNGEGWVPFGQVFTQTYATTFKGNGHTIDHLFINRPAVAYQGLFRIIASNGRVESLGLTNANVTGGGPTGILAGGNIGEIVASYTTGAAVGTNSVGGITGINQGTGAEILSSYSTASVRGVSQVGGLVGRFGSGAITHAYAAGAVARASGALTSIGGLIGTAAVTTGITVSYYDTTTSGCVSGSTTGCTGSAGGSAVVGKTTAELKSPTDYTGIYSTWSANLDGVAGNDAPWDFGTTTDYPALVYHIIVDYDADNDRYIDIANLAQLDAVRRDLNGNGDSTHADYASAFPRRIAGMGCPSTGCAGYELTASLDFDTNGDGSVTTSGDTYWNSGYGFQPIGTYTSNFKGNGHTINNLFISRSADQNVGLFGRANSARIETLGVTNANVRGGDNTGILIGYMNRGNLVACYTTGKVQGGDQTGGLVGYSGFNGGAINTAYSTAYVIGSNYVGGLVGFGTNGSITNSYSTGRVAPANNSGGFLGQSGANHTQSNNYWDTSTSGRSGGIGVVAPGVSPGSSAGVTGKTTRQLQTVTTYTGIYANWNNNLDGVTGNDDPWDLGSKMQYPMLDYKSMSTAPQGDLAMGIPDNWNAPIVGERVSVCIAPGSGVSRATVSGRTYKKGWIWERSDNGDTWETISGTTAPTYEYAPTTADVNHYLRAKVELTDGAFAYTRNLGGRVKNASGATAGAAATFASGNTNPRVGELIKANNPAPTGAVDSRYAWQRCDNSDTTYTDCEYIFGVWWTSYTPTSADLNHYLRMVVYYETSGGVWTRHATAFTGQVAAASQ